MSTLHCTVQNPGHPPGNMIETTIRFQDKYCDSCVRVIEESLYKLSPKPYSVKPSLSGQSVLVLHNATISEQVLQTAFLGSGFIVLGKNSNDERMFLTKEIGGGDKFCINCAQQSETSMSCGPGESLQQHMGRYKVTLAIGGMTCAACTQCVSETIDNIPGTDNIAVSLVNNFAVCTAESQETADLIRDALEESGYEATVVNIELERTSASEEATCRTVTLKVDGISTAQCPERIMSAIELVGNTVTIEKALTTQADPTLVVSYIPKPPSFTIRDIVSAIESSNKPPFRVAVHHPPSLGELTKTIQERERRGILFRLIFAILSAIPTFVIGIVYMSLVRDGNKGRAYLMEPIWGGSASRLEWALFFIATPVMFYSANVFHRSTIKEIKSLWTRGSSVSLLRRFTRFGSMNLLVSSGVTVAYIASLASLVLAATRHPNGEQDNTTYFDMVVFLTMFLLMGRLLEITSKSRMAAAITALSSLRPSEALLAIPDSFSPGKASVEKLEDGLKGLGKEDSSSMLPGKKIRNVPVDLLETGDIICIPYGATPSADGTLINGEKTIFDESSLTGESRLVSKQSGDKVHVGTINKGRMVHVRVDTAGEGTMLENIIRVVFEGQTKRAPIERVATMITGYFVPAITFLAIATWLIWFTLGYSNVLPRDYLDIKVGGWAFWSLRFAIAVFVVACPCGIGLAAPTAFIVGMGVAAKNGILAQGGGEAFQEMSQLDVLVFDKTGTLTEGGEPRVSEFVCVSDGKWEEDTIKGIAAELEQASSHPLALAIRRYCSGKGGTDFVASDVEEEPGCGLKARFKALQCTAMIGNEKWISEHGAILDDRLSKPLERWKSGGKSIALLSIRDDEKPSDKSCFQIAAAFAISDTLRPKTADVIRWFQKQGIDTWMITGDNLKTANAVASLVGIRQENVIADVLPHGKAEKIQQLQQGNIGSLRRGACRNIVAMVGDGINDAPALAAADVGIAIGSGSDVAISSAGFILMSSNLLTLVTLRDLSVRVINRVKFNFVWATVYNLLAVPIAAGAIFPLRHARLDPVWGSLTMTISSCSVVFCSLLLKRYKPKTID